MFVCGYVDPACHKNISNQNKLPFVLFVWSFWVFVIINVSFRPSYSYKLFFAELTCSIENATLILLNPHASAQEASGIIRTRQGGIGDDTHGIAIFMAYVLTRFLRPPSSIKPGLAYAHCIG